MRGYKNGTTKQYKGFILFKNKGEWRAEAYANPSFYNTNLNDIKKQIREYLNS